MSGAVVLGFLGFGGSGMAALAGEYEDAVLALLGDHGGELVFRGRRAEGEDESLPLEVHVIRFRDEDAFAGYLADERRHELMETYGEVFSRKEVVRLDTIVD